MTRATNVMERKPRPVIKVWLLISQSGAPERLWLPTCSDYDEECKDIKDKVKCYLYDPGRGMCPYLRSIPEG